MTYFRLRQLKKVDGWEVVDCISDKAVFEGSLEECVTWEREERARLLAEYDDFWRGSGTVVTKTAVKAWCWLVGHDYRRDTPGAVVMGCRRCRRLWP